MSWTSCMQSKITNYYGDVAANCAQAGSSGNLGDIVQCILGVVAGADPVQVLANLTGWSIACAFEFTDDFKQIHSSPKPK